MGYRLGCKARELPTPESFSQRLQHILMSPPQNALASPARVIAGASHSSGTSWEPSDHRPKGSP